MSHSSLMSRRWLTPLGFGLIILAFVVLGYWPYHAEAASLGRQIAARKERIETNVQESQQLRDLTRQRRFQSLSVKNYDRLVPATQDLGNFLEQLSQELDNTGMRDTQTRALAATKLGKCQQLPIEMHGVGTFAQFHHFLERLESLPRMSSVSKLNIESDAAMTGTLTVDLTLSIYSTKP